MLPHCAVGQFSENVDAGVWASRILRSNAPAMIAFSCSSAARWTSDGSSSNAGVLRRGGWSGWCDMLLPFPVSVMGVGLSVEIAGTIPPQYNRDPTF